MSLFLNTPTLRALILFDRFSALSPTAQQLALAELEREDPAVHQALARLLASDEKLARGDVTDPFARPPTDLVFREATGPDPRLGQRLGPWRITGLLGAGGMGTVYEAQRDDGHYRQRVALKCIRHGLASARIIEGFRRERDILAGLDHPGIAPLFDGGLDEEGCPWFAMRYVQGQPIDTWCDQRSAGVRERVALLVKVCDALAYAHDQRILHQDIKPSNLMVNDAGDVQLLDFGLGISLVEPRSVQRLAVSGGYTAPEALAKVAPSVAADVWSMGMVMYRLLAGTLPRIRPRLMAISDPAAATVPPPTLSQLASDADDDNAQRRGRRSARALSRQLRGDLDAIALRCLAHAPEARYASVAALRDDLRAWLASRPVQAHPADWPHRAGLFLARHRAAAGLAGLLAVTVMTAAVAMAWQKHDAAQRARTTQAMASVFEQTLGQATLSGLAETPLPSRTLLSQAEQRMRGVAADDHPEILAQALGMLARNYAVLGDYTRATELAQEAAALNGDAAPDARDQATLAALLNLQGKPGAAAAIAQSALAALASDDASPARLAVLTELARARWHLADHDSARRVLDDALAAADRANDAAAQAELLTQRAQWNVRLQRFTAAATDAQRAIALATPTHPMLASEARRILVHNLVMQERLPEARATMDRLLADQHALLGESHPLLGRAWRVAGSLRCSSGELDACADALDRAEKIIKQHYGERHPEFAELLQVRALLLGLRTRHAESVALLRRSEALLRAAYPEDHHAVQHVRFMIARRLLYFPQASTQIRTEQLAESIDRLESVHASFARVGLPLRPLDRIALADALEERGAPGDLARARRLLDDNVATLRAFPPTYSVYFLNDYSRAWLAYRDGDATASERVLLPLIASLDVYLAKAEQAGRTHSTLSTDNNRSTLSRARALRAALLVRQGRQADARAWLQRAIEDLAKTTRFDYGMTDRARARLAAFDRTGQVKLD